MTREQTISAAESLHLKGRCWGCWRVTPASSLANVNSCGRCGGRATSPRPITLRQYMNQLRRKLEPDPTRPRHLITEPGMGYRLQA